MFSPHLQVLPATNVAPLKVPRLPMNGAQSQGDGSAAWGLLLLSLGLFGCNSDVPAPPAPLDAAVLREAGAKADAADAHMPSLYAQVEDLLLTRCSFSRCHGGNGRGEANLNFAQLAARGESLASSLVNAPACEYGAYLRVEPGHPERSWLMLKLEGAADAQGTLLFSPAPSWDAGLEANDAGVLSSSTCPRTSGGRLSFGQLMPLSGDRSKPLDAQSVSLVRAWIEAGAPDR